MSDRSKKPTSTKEIRRMKVLKKHTIWTDSLEFHVTSIEPAEPTEFGYCQFIVCTLNGGLVEMNYFYDDIEGAIDLNETGDQWYKIRYAVDSGLYECKPSLARPKENLNAPVGGNKWDKINLGKCRHGILCAIVNSGIAPSRLLANPDSLKDINKLAHFSMTGEVDNNEG